MKVLVLHCTSYNSLLLDSSQWPTPPSQCGSSLNLDVAAQHFLPAGIAWDSTLLLLSAAGTAAAVGAAAATTRTGAPTSLVAYSGLAGTSPRSRCLGMSSPWPALQRFDWRLEHDRGSLFPNNNNAIPFMATSRELTLKMDALDHLQKAIDLIPMIDKIDFLAALQVAPDLVSRESDYFRFMRHADFDAKAAADKLVSYWKYRRSLFEDRTFRPMDMTGNGALTLEEIEVIKSGFIAYAPKDSEGCPVVILNPSRRNTDTADVRMRAAFYHAQYLSGNSTTQTDGFVILCIINSY